MGEKGTCMKIAVVGCGYVFDHYMETLPDHPDLELTGVFDRDGDRLKTVAEYFGLRTYESLDHLLADPTVELVVNLTDPDSHYLVSKAALTAGKHVYSEKPLAVRLDWAKELMELATQKKLLLSSAPCSALSEAAQTIWKVLRDGHIGQPKVVYAELDDNPIYLMRPEEWRNESGAPWPYLNEYQVGCTLEHAGYYLTWLAAFFGPAESVTAFSSCLVADKTPLPMKVVNTPDFSVGCIVFKSGVVARLTCSIVAPHDHRLRIIGNEGIVSVDECWHYATPVSVERFTQLSLNARRSRSVRMNSLFWPLFGIQGRRQKLVIKPRSTLRKRLSEIRSSKRTILGALVKTLKKRELVSMDFFRGVEEMAFAIRQKRRCLLPPDFVLHVNEITLAIQESGKTSSTYRLTTTFEPVSPMTMDLDLEISDRRTEAGLLTRLIERLLSRLHKQ